MRGATHQVRGWLSSQCNIGFEPEELRRDLPVTLSDALLSNWRKGSLHHGGALSFWAALNYPFNMWRSVVGTCWRRSLLLRPACGLYCYPTDPGNWQSGGFGSTLQHGNTWAMAPCALGC